MPPVLITAIALFHRTGIADIQFVFTAAVGVLALWFISYLVIKAALLTGFFARYLLTVIIGIASTCLQIMIHPPQSLDRGIKLTTSGIVTAIDDAIDLRIRLWIELDSPNAVLSVRPHPLIRISTD